jgi:hypothetical protein
MRDMKNIEPLAGLHRIKDQFQKTYLVKQCGQLLDGLDEAIDATFEQAPLRTTIQGYLLDHSTARPPRGSEGKLERQLHRQWSGDSCQPVAGGWAQITHFQVSLADAKDAGGWGEIDLLGASEDGLPVVIELKRGGADDTPAKVIVQAAAYALALQKAWLHLRREWRQVVGPGAPLPTALLPCFSVCVAPTSYWELWSGDHPRAKAVQPGTWEAIRKIVEAFAARGIVIRTAAIEEAGETLSVACFDLPTDTRV